MAARVVLWTTRTGEIHTVLPWSSYKWEKRRNRAGTLSCRINLRNPVARELNLRVRAEGVLNSLAVIENDRVMEAGPIWAHSWDENAGRVEFYAEGIWSLTDRRFMLPLAAATEPLLTDEGEPNPDTNTTFAGVTWPYLVRASLTQMMAWPGGDLPLVFGEDGTGAHDKNYDGSEFKPVGEALEDLTNLENGPEIEFTPRLSTDRRRIEIVVRVGDDVQPQLRSASVHKWDYAVPDRSVKDLSADTDWNRLTSQAWGTGGRKINQALVSRAYSDELLDLGYPFLESLDSSRSDVVFQETLDSYANENLRNGSTSTEFWQFKVRKDRAPFLGDYNIGDLADLSLKTSLWIPPGTYHRRIASMAGDHKKWVTITTDEVPSGG